MKKLVLDKNLEKLSRTINFVQVMEVEVTENSGDYTLEFIADKLAIVLAYSEKLSFYSTELAQHALGVIKGAHNAKALIRMKTTQFMTSPEYMNIQRNNKKTWLEVQLIPYITAYTNWEILEKSLKITQDAISDKITHLRRADSTLRLQTRIFENVNSVGRGVTTLKPGEGLPCEDII